MYYNIAANYYYYAGFSYLLFSATKAFFVTKKTVKNKQHWLFVFYHTQSLLLKPFWLTSFVFLMLCTYLVI